MVKGSGPGEWDALRQELHEFADKHGTFLGGVDNPFYGNLKVYSVSCDSISRTPSDSAL